MFCYSAAQTKASVGVLDLHNIVLKYLHLSMWYLLQFTQTFNCGFSRKEREAQETVGLHCGN